MFTWNRKYYTSQFCLRIVFFSLYFCHNKDIQLDILQNTVPVYTLTTTCYLDQVSKISYCKGGLKAYMLQRVEDENLQIFRDFPY